MDERDLRKIPSIIKIKERQIADFSKVLKLAPFAILFANEKGSATPTRKEKEG